MIKFVCARCGEKLIHGYSCGECGSDEAEEAISDNQQAPRRITGDQPMTQKPEALRLADLSDLHGNYRSAWDIDASAELRRQHTRIVELEAQLAAVPHGVQDATKSAAQGVEKYAEAIRNAVLNCGHTIERDFVTLWFEEKQEGHNALNQLGRRIDAAIAAQAKHG